MGKVGFALPHCLWDYPPLSVLAKQTGATKQGPPIIFKEDQYTALVSGCELHGHYLALLRRIGPARAAYSSVLFPVVALAISTVVEGYQWTVIAAIGMSLTLVGNWLILQRRTT